MDKYKGRGRDEFENHGQENNKLRLVKKTPVARKTKSKKIGRRQKKQLALITVILMVASVIGVMLLTPGFDVDEIKVKGNSVLKAEEIIAASGIKKGENIFDFDKDDAIDNILAIGYIESVDINRELPSTVEITVVEEVGVAYIKADKGYVIITADGRCIDVTNGMGSENDSDDVAVEVPKLPLITGLDKVKYKVGEKISSENNVQMETLFKCLHEFSKNGHVFNMLEIDMSNINKIKFYYMSMDLSVNLGDSSKVDYKMDIFEQILLKIGDNPKGHIDLDRSKPSFRPKKAPEEAKKE